MSSLHLWYVCLSFPPRVIYRFSRREYHCWNMTAGEQWTSEHMRVVRLSASMRKWTNWSDSSLCIQSRHLNVHTTFQGPNILSPICREGSKRGILDLQTTPYPPFIFGVSVDILKGECEIVMWESSCEWGAIKNRLSMKRMLILSKVWLLHHGNNKS